MSDIKTHAVREFHDNADTDDFHVEEIRNIGYTVVDSGLSHDDLEVFRRKIDGIYAEQVREIGGETRLKGMHDAHLARCLIGYDDAFMQLAAHPRLITIATRVLGENFILMSQNGILNQSNDEHYQSTWHRDLNYQHFVSSRPLALSALYCIDEFSAETGGTFLIPASHKSEMFPSKDYVVAQERQVSARAGAILIFDAMVYHRSGHNRSGRVRRAVNHIFTLPLIKQQISFPKMLQGRFSDDPFLRKLLGYDTETGESVQQWRERKLRAAGIA